MNSSVDAGSERSAILASHPERSTHLPAKSIRYKHFAVALCLVGLLGGGCIFSPDKGDGPPPKTDPPFSIRNTPDGAIYYLRESWSRRDSVRIDSVYATDYEGTSQDLTDPNNPVTLTFFKSDEVRSVGSLALSSTISQINMDFFSNTDWVKTHYASDPPEWVSIQIQNFTIYLNDTIKGEFEAKSPKSGYVWFFEFTLRPTYPNGPAADPLWEIVRWKEVRDKN